MDGEIVAWVERRRQWTSGEKAALLAEVEASGGRVSVVARRHRISPSLLYNWRSAWRAAALMARGSASPPGSTEFIQLGTVADPYASAMPMAAVATGPRGAGLALAGRAGVMEIDLAGESGCGSMAASTRRRCGGCCRRCGVAMIGLPPRTKVFLACQPIDLRAGFDGLAAKAQQIIGADPFSGHVFLFRGKRGHYLKGLYWDGSGLCLFAKRLERGKFVLPPLVDGTLTLTPAQLALLIEAMDWRRTIAPPVPSRPMLL